MMSHNELINFLYSKLSWFRDWATSQLGVEYHEAEDILQEIARHYYTHDTQMHASDPTDAQKTRYIQTTIRNKHYDTIRNKKGSLISIEHVDRLSSTFATTNEEIQTFEVKEGIKEVLRRGNYSDREVSIIMYRFNGCRFHEIAKLVRMSERWAKAVLERFRNDYVQFRREQ